MYIKKSPFEGISHSQHLEMLYIPRLELKIVIVVRFTKMNLY